MEGIVSTEINKIRDIEQRKALNAWAAKDFVGSIIAGTGFGKSRVGVLAIEHILKQDSRSNKPAALILVPTVQLQDQFIEEFDKWDVSTENVEIMCYQSAYKLIGHHYDIVVCDEIHLGLSEKYRKFFKYNIYDNLLCMTATPPEEFEYRELLNTLSPMYSSSSRAYCV